MVLCLYVRIAKATKCSNGSFRLRIYYCWELCYFLNLGGQWWRFLCMKVMLFPCNLGYFRAGVPNLWDLVPDDLRWSWCNSSRNKVCNECNVPKPSRNHHPSPLPVRGKLSSMKPVPGAKKVGDHCFRGSILFMGLTMQMIWIDNTCGKQQTQIIDCKNV